MSFRSAKMTLIDGRTTTVRVGDVVNLKDDHQYRVLKIIAPSGPIDLKRTDGSTYRISLFPAHSGTCFGQCPSDGQPVYPNGPTAFYYRKPPRSCYSTMLWP